MLVESGANEITVAGSTWIGGGPPSGSYMKGGDPASVDAVAVPEEPVDGGAEPPEAEVLPALADIPLPAPLTEATEPDVVLPVPAAPPVLPAPCTLPALAVVVPLRAPPPPPLLAVVAPGLAEHAARATQPQSVSEYSALVMCEPTTEYS
jgi:hypothetical protein